MLQGRHETVRKHRFVPSTAGQRGLGLRKPPSSAQPCGLAVKFKFGLNSESRASGVTVGSQEDKLLMGSRRPFAAEWLKRIEHILDWN